MLRTALAFSLLATPALAGPVDFSSGWQEQRLSLFSSNTYSFGQTLQMTSEHTVSIAWSRVPQADWDSTGASWTWSVSESVAPTDLSVKGGDDRNLSLYFVFVPQETAPDLASAGIRALLGRSDVRVIQYAWGGNNPVGQVIPSPYGEPGTGVTIPLRQADTGSESVTVDLAADYARAWGGTPGALIGLAVSGDSDDTRGKITAELSNLVLE
ncbi:MAG: DUF3047 domain-containing protein [Loktanella sp.]|nr:DUF3047 domain-containing protein [Loktanella sp.]